MKRVKRYRPPNPATGNITGRTEYKDRPIMYASHRDSCILSKYAYDVSVALNKFYQENRLSETVIAYRKLGRANYDFAAEVRNFALANAPCVVMCFDIRKFFDTLDHDILKYRLKKIIGTSTLSKDWYAIFRHVTKYSYIERADIESNIEFSRRICDSMRAPIATIAQIKAAGIKICRNMDHFGIPQGTPISSVLSNLYMMDIDLEMTAMCGDGQSLIRRYSDDIIMICRDDKKASMQQMLTTLLDSHKLQLNEDKTEIIYFERNNQAQFQYLGFNLSADRAEIRQTSLSRQWRKAKRSIARTEKIGRLAIKNGIASKIYVRKLRRRFYPVGVRNFSSYARRSSKALGSKHIVRQALRIERMVDLAIRQLT